MSRCPDCNRRRKSTDMATCRGVSFYLVLADESGGGRNGRGGRRPGVAGSVAEGEVPAV